MKLQNKILLLLGILSILPLLLVATVASNVIKNEIIKDQLFALNGISQSQEKKIEALLQENTRLLQLITSRTKLQDSLDGYNVYGNGEDRNSIKRIIDDTIQAVEGFEHISIYDKKNTLVSAVGTLNYVSDPTALEKAKEAIVQDIKTFSEMQYLYLAGPLVKDDALLGTIVVLSSDHNFAAFIDEVLQQQNSLEVLLAKRNADGDAEFLFPRKYEDAAITLDRIVLQSQTDVPITQALLKNENVFSDTIDYRGVPVFAATRYIDSMDWGMVIKVDKSEALSFVERFKKIINLFLIILVIIIAAMSFAFAHSIVYPLQKLQNATKKLAKGMFDTRVDIDTKDEFFDLAESFNKTATILGQVESTQQELEVSKTQFLTISSHELRSPMTPMKAYLQLLARGKYGKLNKKQMEAVETVIRNATRLDNIIVDLLEISRIEAARLKFNFVKTDLKKDILQTIKEMDNFLPEKNVAIKADIKKLGIVEIDPARVSQVLRNLINNAKKFSPNNTTIQVSVQRKKGMIHFAVTDQGTGISSLEVANVFEPFFQENRNLNRNAGGTGLGLTICKGIVESQKGTISVESTEGKGTTFHFTFPTKPVRKTKSISSLFSPHKIKAKKKSKSIETKLKQALHHDAHPGVDSK